MDFDTTIAAKAVSTEENGDLIIEGYAATWEKDREGWRFEPQSFVSAAKAYVENGGPLLIQHDPKLGGFGRVESAEVREGGVWIRGRIPEPAASSPLRDWYQKVRDGIVTGLSVRGPSMIRKLNDGSYAARMKDWIETSITPTPMNTGGMLAVAQKALEAGEATAETEATEPSEADVEKFRTEMDAKLATAQETLDELEADLTIKELAQGDFEEETANKGVTAQQRKDAKFVMSDGSFPINHCGRGSLGVGAALSDLGRTSKPRAKVLAHIRRAANALGCGDKYPALRAG